MKAKIPGLLAAGLIGFAATAPIEAAPITVEFTVTLNVNSGAYLNGHVFTISATYDDAGTSMTDWNDGVNGVAEFGQGDDTVLTSFNLPFSNYTLLSDAQISISGLDPLPAGASPRDNFNGNRSRYFEMNSYWQLELFADSQNLVLTTFTFDPTFYVNNFYYDQQQNPGNLSAGSLYGSEFSVSRRIVPSPSVPEPGTLALLGLGLAGLGLSRRRKAN